MKNISFEEATLEELPNIELLIKIKNALYFKALDEKD